jgi:hypothetical protein
LKFGPATAFVQQDAILANAIAVAKTSASKPRARGGKPAARGLGKGSAGRTKTVQTVQTVQRDENTGQLAISKARFEAVILAAERSGLLGGKSGRIGGRVSPALVRQAKRQTVIVTDSDLIEFALASVALEDNFAETFKESRGKVDPR